MMMGLHGSVLRAESSSWQEYKGKSDPTYFPITQILEGDPQLNLIIFAAGSSSGIIKGMVLDALRPAPGALLEGQKFKCSPGTLMPPAEAGKGLTAAQAKKNLWIQTGRIRALEVQELYTIAQIEKQGSPMSQAFFPQFAGVMVGDMVTIPDLRLARRPVIVPTLTLSYFGLFDDPQQRPSTLEVSREGHKLLREAALQLASLRLSMLLVEGYTDQEGPSDENQRESYQRALTIRQVLIDEYQFDPQKVVAIGYGELELQDATFAPGSVQRNRRIVLKPVPSSEMSSD